MTIAGWILLVVGLVFYLGAFAQGPGPTMGDRPLQASLFSLATLCMVAGIVLFAFAMKTTLAHVGDELETIPALGLCGGPALYLFAYVALRLRITHTLGRGRLAASVACALLWPVAVVVPALVALTLVAVVWVALHAYEIIWWREARARARTLRDPVSAS